MGIRRRIKTAVQDIVFADEVTQMKTVLRMADAIYREGKFALPPEQLIQQLIESDAYGDLVQRLQLDEYFLFNSDTYSYDRNRAVAYARYMSATDQNVSNAVEMWTDFSLGKGVRVESENYPSVERAFNASQNEQLFADENVHQISFDALNEGELAFAYWFDPLTVGITAPSIRAVPTDQLEIIWLDENDKTTPLFYKRQLKDGTAVFYPDWRARVADLDKVSLPANAKRTDRMSAINPQNGRLTDGETAESLVAVMSWSRMNKYANGRGLPRFRVAFEWAKVLTQFMSDRAAVSRKAAMYTENVTISGGSRSIRDAVQRLQSSLVNSAASGTIYDTNPPPVAGSDWIQNDQVSREWQNRDTGANNASLDGRMLAGQLSLGTGVAPHWAGFPDSIPGGLATARELLKPWMAKIERYQLWLSGTFKTIALVCANIEAQLVLTDSPRIQKNETDISVSLLSPILTDTDQLTAVLGAINTSMKDGTLDPTMGALAQEIILVLLMTKVGVPDYEAQLEQLAQEEPVATAVDQGDGTEQTPIDAETLELMEQILINLENGLTNAGDVSEFISDLISNGA